MSLALETLSDSPFLANLGPGEKSFWRFLVALVGGLFAFVVVAIVATVATFALYVLLLGWPAPVSLAGLRALAQSFLDLAASDGRSFADAMQIIGLVPSNNVLPIFAFIGIALLLHRRRLGAFLTAAPHFRWRMLIAGLVLSTLVIVPFLVADQLSDPKAGPVPVVAVAQDAFQRVIYVVVCFAVFVPAAMGEEILFRGWLLRQTSNITRQALVLMAINGVLFAAAHFDFTPDAFLERALMGAGFTYMTLRLGGVEMSCGVHAANNLLILLFLQPLTLKQAPNAPLDAGTAVSYAGLFAAYIGLAELMARWAPLRQWAGAASIPARAEAGRAS